jgi:hypothetical protein
LIWFTRDDIPLSVELWQPGPRVMETVRARASRTSRDADLISRGGTLQIPYLYGGHGKKLPECQECQDFRLGISSLLPSYRKWVLFRNNCY